MGFCHLDIMEGREDKIISAEDFCHSNSKQPIRLLSFGFRVIFMCTFISISITGVDIGASQIGYFRLIKRGARSSASSYGLKHGEFALGYG